ncbi:ribonuclease P protein component [Micromonospora sp. SH-82]|uniref:ribonuclease P protein component n=1 Tax=Micromonospora sp. SH-82 TaxID=3132938 RepID=UPI003EC03B95
MLAAAQRLRRSTDFAVAVRAGRRVGRGSLVVHLTLPTSTSPKPARESGTEELSAPTRAGFVVSKAVGPAVVRNRVRRRLRHLVRDRLGELPTGSNLVVRALPSAAEASYSRLGADLDAALEAARTARARRSR